MEDVSEEKGLLEGAESKRNHGTLPANGHSTHHNHSMYQEMDTAVDNDDNNDTCNR